MHEADREVYQARVAVPATCGELMQGSLDGVRCLVSCPIGCYSLAEVRLWPGPGRDTPPDAPKSARALQSGLLRLGRPDLGGELRLLSPLPRGRGYGTSTADVGATLYALSQALERPFSPPEASQLAVEVEPSDSTLFPGLALFDHRESSFHRLLGSAPPLLVMVLDPGGEVDTLTFNRLNHRQALSSLAPQHREAFDLLQQGILRGDWSAFAEAATISARAHQAILPNPLLEPTLALGREVGALGVCRAHSGTLLGLLLTPLQVDLPAALDFVTRRLPAGVSVACYPLVDGGPRFEADLGRLERQDVALASLGRAIGG